MVPVAMLFVRRWRADPATLLAQVRGLVRSVAAFLVAFLVITPGAILQWSDFVEDVRGENRHYRILATPISKGASSYNVPDYSLYQRQMRYVAVSLPSHSPLISLLVVALAILGVVTLVRRELWFAIAVMLPGLISVLLLTLVKFIVRNFLAAFVASLPVYWCRPYSLNRAPSQCSPCLLPECRLC